METFTHQYFMKQALQEAQKALQKDEIPIGVVVVANNRIIARAYNLMQTLNDTTAHAEMQAITSATNYLDSKYLNECTLYVTIEPCPMCAAALNGAQIKQLVYGAPEPKKGYTQYSPNLLHKRTEVINGIMENECSQLIKSFFKSLRK